MNSVAKFQRSGAPAPIPTAVAEKYEEKRMIAGGRAAALIDTPSHSAISHQRDAAMIPHPSDNSNEVRANNAWYTDPTVLVGVVVCGIAYFAGKYLRR